MNAVVITVSDRSAAGDREDVSGPLAVDLLTAQGFSCSRSLVPDDVDAVTTALRAAVGADLVVTTGGTGLGPRDVTPEATSAVIERPAPGLADLVRRAGTVPTAALSRGVAGVVGRTLVVNLAGSPGAVRDGLAALEPLLPHAVAQLRGADHCIEISAEPVDVGAVLAAVADPRAGGHGVFVGTVRTEDEGRAVTALAYEAHPSAADVLRAICAREAASDGVVAVAAVHRSGELVIGDVAVVVAVSAVHRAEALDTARRLIDAIKHEVPIWKRQTFADGDVEWVGAC